MNKEQHQEKQREEKIEIQDLQVKEAEQEKIKGGPFGGLADKPTG